MFFLFPGFGSYRASIHPINPPPSVRCDVGKRGHKKTHGGRSLWLPCCPWRLCRASSAHAWVCPTIWESSLKNEAFCNAKGPGLDYRILSENLAPFEAGVPMWWRRLRLQASIYSSAELADIWCRESAALWNLNGMTHGARFASYTRTIQHSLLILSRFLKLKNFKTKTTVIK